VKGKGKDVDAPTVEEIDKVMDKERDDALVAGINRLLKSHPVLQHFLTVGFIVGMELGMRVVEGRYKQDVRQEPK
jgi:hypothetical protein